jgi:hypothetical protein
VLVFDRKLEATTRQGGGRGAIFQSNQRRNEARKEASNRPGVTMQKNAAFIVNLLSPREKVWGIFLTIESSGRDDPRHQPELFRRLVSRSVARRDDHGTLQGLFPDASRTQSGFVPPSEIRKMRCLGSETG